MGWTPCGSFVGTLSARRHNIYPDTNLPYLILKIFVPPHSLLKCFLCSTLLKPDQPDLIWRHKGYPSPLARIKGFYVFPSWIKVRRDRVLTRVEVWRKKGRRYPFKVSPTQNSRRGPRKGSKNLGLKSWFVTVGLTGRGFVGVHPTISRKKLWGVGRGRRPIHVSFEDGDCEDQYRMNRRPWGWR